MTIGACGYDSASATTFHAYFDDLPFFHCLTQFSSSSPWDFWTFCVRVDRDIPLVEGCGKARGCYNMSNEDRRVSEVALDSLRIS